MKWVDERLDAIRKFERHEREFKQLVTELNETILPAVSSLRTFNDYALGEATVLVHAVQVTSVQFRLDRLPKLKDESEYLELNYIGFLRGEVAMLEKMTEMLGRSVEHLKRFV